MSVGGWPAAVGLLAAAAAATGGMALGIVPPEVAGALVLGVAAAAGVGERVSTTVIGLPLGVGVTVGMLTVAALLLPATDAWLAVGVGLAVAGAALVGLVLPAVPIWSVLAGVGAVLAVPGALGAQPPDGELVLAVVLALGWGAASGAIGVTVALLLARAASHSGDHGAAEAEAAALTPPALHAADDRDAPTDLDEPDEPDEPDHTTTDPSPEPTERSAR